MKRPFPAEYASALIDERIKELGDWRGKTLAKVRELIHEADPEIVEEASWARGPVDCGESVSVFCFDPDSNEVEFNAQHARPSQIPQGPT